MYEAHFGMQGRAFDSAIVHDVDVFLGREQETLIGRFKFALASPDAVVTLSGPAGVGKTTLASAAVQATSTRLALAWLNSVPTNATELLELLLVELGMNAHRTTRIERLQMWRQYLSELNATESRVFVIAERTEDLAPEVLRALDSLTAADATGCAGANIVLLGRPGLDQFLAAPELDSLRQRIRLRQRLEPFSSAELTDYLRHRIERAGGNFVRVFAADAAAAVYRYSGGVARVANNLCETALGIAAADGRPQVTAALIREVAVDMLGLVEPRGGGAVVSSPQTEARTPSAEPMQSASTTPPPATPPVMTASAVEPPPRNAAASASAPITPLPPVAAPAAIATAPATVAPPPAAVTPPPAAIAPPPPALTPPAPERMATVAAAPTPAVGAPPPSSPMPPPSRVAMPPAPPAARPIEAALPPFGVAPLTATEPTRATTREFDATATDIPDVSSFDFPVLTDAIEEPAAPTRAADAPRPPGPARSPAPAPLPPMAKAPPPMAAPILPSAAPSAKAASPAPSAAPAATMRPAAAAPPRPPSSSPPPPLVAPRAAKPPAPPPAAAPKAATPPAAPAAKAPAPPEPAAAVDEDADVLRQTQTMRAISVAKSIDDISSSMAETLFGDAELDLLSAALASAGFEEPADDDAAPQSEPDAESELSESDDIMDLFNLGPDAPLELIDDSAAPPGNSKRKTATRR